MLKVKLSIARKLINKEINVININEQNVEELKFDDEFYSLLVKDLALEFSLMKKF